MKMRPPHDRASGHCTCLPLMRQLRWLHDRRGLSIDDATVLHGDEARVLTHQAIVQCQCSYLLFDGWRACIRCGVHQVFDFLARPVRRNPAPD